MLVRLHGTQYQTSYFLFVSRREKVISKLAVFEAKELINVRRDLGSGRGVPVPLSQLR